MDRIRLYFLLMLFTIGATNRVNGQVRGDHTQRFFLDLNLIPGISDQKFTSIPLTGNYPDVLNGASGKLNYTKGTSLSYNMQAGFYLTKKKSFAISIGCLYTSQTGHLGVDTFHVEYRSVDYKGDVFRQLITANNGIDERIKTNTLSIPVLFKYRLNLSTKLFCTVDAGILFTIQSQSNSSSNASFNYEAVYDMQGTGTQLTYLFDNSPVPGAEDWLITKAEFLKNNPKGNIQEYFNSLKSIGYNVGMNESTTNKNGSVNFSGASISYLLQPAVNFSVTENVVLKLGLSYFLQPMKNTSRQKELLLIDQAGNYNSLLNYTTNVQRVDYGITFGLSFYLNSYIDKVYDSNNQARAF